MDGVGSWETMGERRSIFAAGTRRTQRGTATVSRAAVIRFTVDEICELDLR